MTYGVNWDASSQGPIGMPADRPGNFHNVRLAGWWARVGAGIVDYGAVGLFPAGICNAICKDMGISTNTLIWIPYVLIFLNSGYMASRTTQSLGKRLLGIRMVQSVIPRDDPSGAYAVHVPLLVALIRLPCHFFDCFPAPLGWFLPIINKNKSTVADVICRTLNVRDNRLPEPELKMRGKREWAR